MIHDLHVCKEHGLFYDLPQLCSLKHVYIYCRSLVYVTIPVVKD